jgi:hypothetical protein
MTGEDINGGSGDCCCLCSCCTCCTCMWRRFAATPFFVASPPGRAAGKVSGLCGGENIADAAGDDPAVRASGLAPGFGAPGFAPKPAPGFEPGFTPGLAPAGFGLRLKSAPAAP